MEIMYLIKPAEDGTREDTKLAFEYSAEEIQKMISNGYYLVDSDTFNKLIGNAEVEYCMAMDGTLYEKPPYVPTADDQLAALDTEYGIKIAEINNLIILAAAEGEDTSELVAEKAELKTEYIQKRGDIQ